MTCVLVRLTLAFHFSLLVVLRTYGFEVRLPNPMLAGNLWLEILEQSRIQKWNFVELVEFPASHPQ